MPLSVRHARGDDTGASGLPAGLRKNPTYDNGLENILYERTNAELGIKSHFCKPYHSWEKGSIENRNRILQRYFPKT
jgi:IS30 family transposase